MGPLPRTKNGSEYILKDQTAIYVAGAFIKRFICTFGAPQAMLTDQGTNCLSKLIKCVAKRFRIKQVKTTAFHP